MLKICYLYWHKAEHIVLKKGQIHSILCTPLLTLCLWKFWSQDQCLDVDLTRSWSHSHCSNLSWCGLDHELQLRVPKMWDNENSAAFKIDNHLAPSVFAFNAVKTTLQCSEDWVKPLSVQTGKVMQLKIRRRFKPHLVWQAQRGEHATLHICPQTTRQTQNCTHKVEHCPVQALPHLGHNSSKTVLCPDRPDCPQAWF